MSLRDQPYLGHLAAMNWTLMQNLLGTPAVLLFFATSCPAYAGLLAHVFRPNPRVSTCEHGTLLALSPASARQLLDRLRCPTTSEFVMLASCTPNAIPLVAFFDEKAHCFTMAGDGMLIDTEDRFSPAQLNAHLAECAHGAARALLLASTYTHDLHHMVDLALGVQDEELRDDGRAPADLAVVFVAHDAPSFADLDATKHLALGTFAHVSANETGLPATIFVAERDLVRAHVAAIPPMPGLPPDRLPSGLGEGSVPFYCLFREGLVVNEWCLWSRRSHLRLVVSNPTPSTE